MPLTSIDHVLVAVNNLGEATAAYERLLGRRVSLTGSHPAYGSANAIFQLQNTYIELITPAGTGPFADILHKRLDEHGEGVVGLAFGTDDAQALSDEWRAQGLRASKPQAGEGRSPDGTVREWRNVFVPPEDVHGLFFFAIEHVSDAASRPRAEATSSEDEALYGVDHVVVHTADGDDAIDLFGNKMGIRLALDRDAPQWGARMLFFRLGGITLEVIQRYGDDKHDPMPKDAPWEYWGMAFKAADVDKAQARLLEAGADVSDVRKGRKPGTRVATVRSGTCGVPTLLIGPDPDHGPEEKTAKG